MLPAQLLPGRGLAPALIAQLGFDPPDFDPLPGPPISQWLVLEQPWYLTGALVVLGVAILEWLRRQESLKAGIIIGGAVVLLGAGVMLLGSLVETDRERVKRLTRDLIGAIATPNAYRTDLLLGEEGGVVAERGRWEFTRDEVLGEIRSAQQAGGRYAVAGVGFKVSSYRLREIRAQVLSAGFAKTQVNVVGELESGRIMPASWWEIDWVREPGDRWRARLIETIWIQGR